MPLMTWNSRLSVGVEKLDEQHHDQHSCSDPHGPHARVHVSHRLIAPVSDNAVGPTLFGPEAAEVELSARSVASACSVALSFEIRSKMASRM